MPFSNRGKQSMRYGICAAALACAAMTSGGAAAVPRAAGAAQSAPADALVTLERALEAQPDDLQGGQRIPHGGRSRRSSTTARSRFFEKLVTAQPLGRRTPT